MGSPQVTRPENTEPAPRPGGEPEPGRLALRQPALLGAASQTQRGGLLTEGFAAPVGGNGEAPLAVAGCSGACPITPLSSCLPTG